MQVACTGREIPVLVFSGQFTANALQGAAMALDPSSGAFSRVDFAERNRPRWIALDGPRFSVIFENSGQESTSRYLIYRTGGRIDEVDELPSATLFELTRDTEPAIDGR
ncbi:hypothetical protein D3C78_1594440 [compost metagenome]